MLDESKFLKTEKESKLMRYLKVDGIEDVKRFFP